LLSIGKKGIGNNREEKRRADNTREAYRKKRREQTRDVKCTENR
jgi:hypothetical protein